MDDDVLVEPESFALGCGRALERVGIATAATHLGADIVGGAHFELLRLPVTAPPAQATVLAPVNSPGTDS